VPEVSVEIEAAGIAGFGDGTMRKIMVGGRGILLARVKGQFFAVEANCPHLEGDLSEGTLRDTILTCPMHHSQFDIRDGHVVRWTDMTGIALSIDSRVHPPRALRHYPVRVEGDRILISFEI
jgi:3-phenylpropionate/trans-cinnamate dioxygenase ferredoxin component